MSKCKFCDHEAIEQVEAFNTGKLDLKGNEIVVPSVKSYQCTNAECEMSWLPASEEERIDQYILKHSRYVLNSDEIKTFREALGFSTKSAASDFLTFNTKAFTKWENNYTELNLPNDLLIRLVCHSQENYNFVKDLHKKNFAFDPADYQLICNQTGTNWNYSKVEINDGAADMYKKILTALEELAQKTQYIEQKTAPMSNYGLTAIAKYGEAA